MVCRMIFACSKQKVKLCSGALFVWPIKQADRGLRSRMQPKSMQQALRQALWMLAVCNCGNQPFSPVCGDGLTWSTACDAKCNSHPCYTQGVCQYNPSGGSVADPGNACSGGALSLPLSRTLIRLVQYSNRLNNRKATSKRSISLASPEHVVLAGTLQCLQE